MTARMRGLIVAAVAALATAFAVPAMAAGGGTVYTLTNAASGNTVLAFDRAADGALTAAGSTAAGGLGSGAGLGSQGAVVLSEDGGTLFAVNAGSDSISSFAVTPAGLRLRDTAPSGGDLPISITVNRNLVYVLNAGSPNSISGLTVDHHGRLTPLPGSTRPLSAAAADPAQVQFSPDGRVLVVSEKATDRLTSYVVGAQGIAGPPTAFPSTGTTPFGFAFTKRGDLVVSNAASTGASSYAVAADGSISPITALATGQAAACWTVVTPNGRFAYTTNTAAGNISGYAVAHDGSISLLDHSGITAVTGGSPADAALSRNGHFLYVRNGSRNAIDAFRIAADGSLLALGATTGLPAGLVGLAAS